MDVVFPKRVWKHFEWLESKLEAEPIKKEVEEWNYHRDILNTFISTHKNFNEKQNERVHIDIFY